MSPLLSDYRRVFDYVSCTLYMVGAEVEFAESNIINVHVHVHVLCRYLMLCSTQKSVLGELCHKSVHKCCVCTNCGGYIHMYLYLRPFLVSYTIQERNEH